VQLRLIVTAADANSATAAVMLSTSTRGAWSIAHSACYNVLCWQNTLNNVVGAIASDA
jgi:hypothetical protein